MTKRSILLLNILLLFFLTGCSFKSDFYGKYKNINNTYEGFADFGATDGKMQIWSSTTAETCNGEIIYNDGETSITGVNSGTSTLTCSTGKTLKGQWFIPNNWDYVAKGQFVDSNGEIMYFVFGENIDRFKYLVNAPIVTQRIPKQHFVIPKRKAEVKSGTGFFITNDGYLITNYHVIDGSSKIYIKKDSKQLVAKIIDIDKENDLAILKIDALTYPISVFSGDDVKKGTKITSFGYPLIGIQGNELKTTFGHINSTSGLRGDTTYYQIDTPIQPGNSGGPILNYYGEAVGVVTATLNQQNTLMTSGTFTQNVNYAVKSNRVVSLLKKNNLYSKDTLILGKKLNEVELVNIYEKSVVIIIAH